MGSKLGFLVSQKLWDSEIRLKHQDRTRMPAKCADVNYHTSPSSLVHPAETSQGKSRVKEPSNNSNSHHVFRRHRSTTYGVTNNCPHSKATRYTCRNMGSGKYRPPGKRRGSASEIPDRKDLPTLLTAAGMVRLCGRPENFGSPLIGLDVAPTK